MLLDLKRLLSQCNISVRGVIHVGAHHGQELPLYCSLGAREMALFEPLAKNFQQLCKTVDAIRHQPNPPRMDCYPLALGTVHEVKEMTIASNEGQSSSLLKPKEHLKIHPQVLFGSCEKVHVTRMDRIVTQPQRYNLLSIDVQGYELEVLKGAGASILACIEAICCEVNRSENYEGNAMVEEIDAYLSGHGFERLSTVWAGGTWGDAFYAKRNSAEKPLHKAVTQASAETRLREQLHRHQIDADFALGRQLIPVVHMHDRCLLEYNDLDSATDTEKPIEAIKIMRMGRYSNNIIQLLHASLIAARLGVKQVELPPGFAHLSAGSFQIRDLSFSQHGMAKAKIGKQLTSYYWFPRGSLRTLFTGISTQQACQAANQIVKPIFYQYFPMFNVTAPKHDDRRMLVAHLRSGDLFRSNTDSDQSPRPHPVYVQPPLSFYTLSIEHALSGDAAPSHIKLVIEDNKNPVVNALAEWLRAKLIPFEIVGGDFQEAIETMLSAQAIISAYGSVIEMIGMLSDTLESVYTFRGYGRWAESSFGGHGHYELLGNLSHIYELQLEGEYIEPGQWRDTKEQRELMLNYQASATALSHKHVTPRSDATEPFFLFE